MLVALGTKDGREVTFKRKDLATRHGNIDTRTDGIKYSR